MATITVTMEIDFGDYFTKFGFGDGDGPELNYGYHFRPTAIRLFNEALKKYRVRGIKAVDIDPGNIHNNCQIALSTGKKDDYVDIGPDCEGLEMTDLDDKVKENIVKSYNMAEDGFNKVVSEYKENQ